jgi:hypothetical protein
MIQHLTCTVEVARGSLAMPLHPSKHNEADNNRNAKEWWEELAEASTGAESLCYKRQRAAMLASGLR